MFENSKNLIDQTSLISWSNQQKVTVHAITMLIQCCLISHPWYKPASLLYTIVLHESISVTDLKSAWGGISSCICMGGSGQRRSCIYMHASYKDLHFFDNIIWGDIPFPTYEIKVLLQHVHSCMNSCIWILKMYSRKDTFLFSFKIMYFLALNVYFLC